jgi:hypothetical protein
VKTLSVPSPDQANLKDRSMLRLPKQFLKRVFRMIGDSMGLHEIASEIKRLSETVQQIQYQTAVASDGLPLPSAELHFLVSGRRDLDAFDFWDIGKNFADGIISTLSRHGVEIDELEAILDFGCGCGRLSRGGLPNSHAYSSLAAIYF